MKRWICGVLLASLIVCTGADCVATRLSWSPDGKYLAVATGEKLLLADAQGKLLDTSLPGVKLLAWFPDSRGFVAVRDKAAPTWEAARAGIAPERQKQLLVLADRLREEVVSYEGEWDNFKPKTTQGLVGSEFLALMLYVRDHRGEGLAAKLGEKKWKDLEKLSVALQVVQLYDVKNAKPEPGSVIGVRIASIPEIRLSPDGKTLAMVEALDDQGNAQLLVSPINGGEWRQVAQTTAHWPDWSSDGRYLVYGTRGSDLGDSLQLGTLSRREVCGASGRLLDSFADPEELAGLLFFPQMKVRCLRDGRILFSSAEVTLPSTQRDMPQRASLFTVDPDRQPAVSRMIPRDAETQLPKGIELGLFELSPDQTRVVVMGSESDKAGIAVLTLATGEVESVITDVKDIEAHVPAWRTPGELSFLAPAGAPGAPAENGAVLSWSLDGQTRCMSCGWDVSLGRQEKPAQPTTTSVSVN